MSILGNLTKAVVRTALTPVTIATDVIMFLPDAEDITRPTPMDRTITNFSNIAKDVENAINSEDVL